MVLCSKTDYSFDAKNHLIEDIDLVNTRMQGVKAGLLLSHPVTK